VIWVRTFFFWVGVSGIVLLEDDVVAFDRLACGCDPDGQ
jgi:hypothetical protein